MPNIKDWLDLYETGKHRRYNLLFAVNGGAFAVAKLLVGTPGDAATVLGGLTLPSLSLGMVLFTVVMVADIFVFGNKLRVAIGRDGGAGVFGPVGKIVLSLLGLLIAAGWFLVGFGGTSSA